MRLREAMMEAMLAACGELGYNAVAVEDVVERSDGSREQFYEQFTDLRDCFQAAYRDEAGRLGDGMLRAGASAGSWREGLHAAIQILVTFVVERPLVARALTIEVHLAGEGAQEARRELHERLSRALDSGRDEIASGYSPPPLTALFMVSAIDAAVVTALVRARPESFAEAAPELEHLVATAYLGDEIPGDEPA
jgi:AcrR family transcriptional regulator